MSELSALLGELVKAAKRQAYCEEIGEDCEADDYESLVQDLKGDIRELFRALGGGQ
jgi:hypothetical protein